MLVAVCAFGALRTKSERFVRILARESGSIAHAPRGTERFTRAAREDAPIELTCEARALSAIGGVCANS